MSSATRRFADLTTAEVGTALSRDSVLVLPTGAVEPHGPHLPMSTDLVVAEELSAAVVDAGARAGHDVWLMPALAYTKSDEHAELPGTIWTRASTFFETLVDIGASIVGTPARRLLVINAHGGNSALVEVAARELRRRFGLQTFFAWGPATPPTERGPVSMPAGPRRRSCCTCVPTLSTWTTRTPRSPTLSPDTITSDSPRRSGSAGCPPISANRVSSATPPARPPPSARSCSTIE